MVAPGFFQQWDVGGGQRPASLKHHDSVKEFVDSYGLTIRGEPFDWDRYAQWVDIYEDDCDDIVLQCSAQVGKSVFVMSHMLREAVRNWGGMFGYYFPDYHLPKAFSEQRFKPFVRSSPELGGWMGRNYAKEKGTDQVLTRTLGPSVLFFLSTRGTTATEGLPMAAIYFDELRRMEASDVLLAEKRISAQARPKKVKVSTARHPDQDINAEFNATDQRHWHTDCGGCADGVVLAETFPKCTLDLKSATPALLRKVQATFDRAGRKMWPDGHREKYPPAVFQCPTCGNVIPNPLEGWWEPHNPGVYAHGYQMSQLTLWTYSAARALYEWNHPNADLQVLYNDMLGRPFVNPDARPVQRQHLMACVDEQIDWPAHQSETWRRRNMSNCALGYDVQKGYGLAVIKRRAKSGKFQTVHVEVVHYRGGKPADQWKRLGSLMVEYDVRFAVLDAQPEWDAVLSFAQAFEGRVWLAYYTEAESSSMISWKDRKKAPADQRDGEAKFPFIVTISRTKALDWSLKRWVNRHNEVPNPRTLIQQLPVVDGKPTLRPNLSAGSMGAVAVCRDIYFPHQRAVLFNRHYVNDAAKRMGIYTIRASHLGQADFAHANLYADVALSRAP